MVDNRKDDFKLNDLIFVPDKEEGFTPAEVMAEFKRGQEGKVRLKTRNDVQRRVTKEESEYVERMDSQSYEDVPDLIKLKLLNNASLLYNLRLRYCEKESMVIYTNIGAILVAINPYEDLGLYTAPLENKYLNAGSTLSSLEPHIFKVAETAFNQMRIEGKDQSCVITGESGAGKTETTKRFLQYVSEKSKRNREATGADFGVDTEKLRQQILDSNPFMEAFGNAKTSKNDNSSRFGKLIEMYFNTEKGVVVEAQITSYLLEKSRVVKVAKGERSYHIFYQLCAAAASRESGLKKDFYLQPADGFRYTLGDNDNLQDLEVPDTDDADIYEETKAAMRKLNLSEAEIMNTFRICAAVLHIGNIEFKGGAKDLCELKSGVRNTALSNAADLLKVDDEALESAILERKLRDKDVKRHTVQEAEAARDAMAKFLYEKLFNWLIGNMNLAMSQKQRGKIRSSPRVLAVLDIFGFESFQRNSFEQLCINFCNEKLQAFFNLHVFKKEQQEYKDEGVDFKRVGFYDNQGVINALEKGNHGIMILCDDLSKIEQANDDTLLSRILNHAVESKAKNYRDNFLFKPKIQDQRQHKHLIKAFVVKHFAGMVHYNIEGFLEKNKDQLRRDIRICLATSECPLIKGFFPHGGDVADGKQANFKNTLSKKFRNSLNQLMGKLNSTTPQFVRCIKPNNKKEPGFFNHLKIMKQLNEAGLLEVCRIRKLGYPVKKTHKEFMNEYLCLERTAKNLLGLETKLMERGILYATKNSNNWVIGNTKVFMRSDQFYELERRRAEALKETLRIMQSFARKVVFRVKVKKALKALKRIQVGMATKDGEMLNKGLNFFLEKGPLFAQLPIVVDGLRVMKDLEGQIDLVKELRDAIDIKDYNTIRVKLELAEKMQFEHEILKEARAMLDEYELVREVIKRLQQALTSQDVEKLEAAIKYADSKKHTSSKEYEQCVASLKTLKERGSVMDALKKELEKEKPDKALIKRLVGQLRAVGVPPEHPMLVMAARKGEMLIEMQKKQEKEINKLKEQLEKYIRKKNLSKLKRLVGAAVRIKYTGPLVQEAMELITSLEQRQELLDEVSYASRVLMEKSKLQDGITEVDLAPLQHAIKTAKAVDHLDLDKELQVLEAERMLERGHKQITVQDEVEKTLETSTPKNLFKMLEKVQALGLQTRGADQLVQKVREIEMIKARSEALLNAEKTAQNLAALQILEGKERMQHLKKRLDNMLDNDFKQLIKECRMSKDLTFPQYYKIRGDADYLSNERRSERKERKARKFGYEEDRPITRSLIEIDDLQNEKAIQINHSIHKYCDSLKGNMKDTLTGYASFVVEYGICDRVLADEILLQLCKHITSNSNKLSKRNAWHLLCLCSSYFCASKQFLPYVIFFLQSFTDEVGSQGNYSRYIISQLSSSSNFDPLLENWKPGKKEIKALFTQPPLLAQVLMVNGDYVDVPIPPDFKLRQASPLIRKATGIKIDLKKPEWAFYLSSKRRPKQLTFKQRLENFYTYYKPENLGNVDQILAYYKGREAALFETLVNSEEYGPEPDISQDLALVRHKNIKKKSGQSDESKSVSSFKSSFSRSTVGSVASNVTKASAAVSKVFRRMRGLSTVDIKDLDKPTPRFEWPLPWWVRLGDVVNNIYSQNLVPVLSYKRRRILPDMKLDDNLFLQCRHDFVRGLLMPTETECPSLSAILLCESIIRRKQPVPYGDKRKLIRLRAIDYIPKTLKREHKKKREWKDAYYDILADNTNSLEGKSQAELQQMFFEEVKKLETFGMNFFFAQVLKGNVRSYVAKAQTPEDFGVVKVGISYQEMVFFGEDNSVTASFRLDDIVSSKTEAQTFKCVIKKGVKRVDKNEKPKERKMVRTKSLRARAGQAVKGLGEKVFGVKTTTVQLYTLQPLEMRSLIIYNKYMANNK